jgi:hypothetical protein
MSTKHLLINSKQNSAPPSGGNYGLAVTLTFNVVAGSRRYFAP